MTRPVGVTWAVADRTSGAQPIRAKAGIPPLTPEPARS